MKKNLFLKTFIPFVLIGIFPIVVFFSLTYNELSVDSYIILAVLVVFVFLFSFVISRQFISPLEKIIEGAKKAEKGELNVKVNVEPGERFTQLLDFFNKMAQQLEESRYLTEETQKVVEKETKNKTEELNKKVSFLREQLQKTQKEIQDKDEELDKFRDATIKRELEMMKLKKEIKKLKGEESENEGEE